MHFDPTYNYGNTDLTSDENLVFWKLGELVKNLVILSSPAKQQIEIIGIGAVCDEMAIDFDTYFSLEYPKYLDNGLLTIGQVDKLKALDKYFEERSGDKSPDFWDDTLLETSTDWQEVRQKAKIMLETLHMQDLAIVFERTEQFEITDKGKQLMIQTTKTRLVKQNTC